MTTLTCNELRAMAAEVALGILSGAERADALGHMEHCVSCRVLVGGTAAGVTLIEHNGSGGQAQVADQTALRSGHFQAGDGRPVGQVYTYSGNPSWVFMNVDASGANGTYTCELQLANGTTVPVGQFEVHDGVGEWAHTVGVDVNQIRTAKLVTPSGLTLATAKVS